MRSIAVVAMVGVLLLLGGCNSSDRRSQAPASSTTAPARTVEVRAVTYNVAGLPAALSGSDPEQNQRLIGPLLNDYDLVLTQEDWQTPQNNPLPAFRVYHDELTAGLTLPYRTEPAPLPLGSDSRRPTALVSDGMNVFSTSPFNGVTRVMWPVCTEPEGSVSAERHVDDCLSLKGFSLTVHTLENGAVVHVYDLHGGAQAHRLEIVEPNMSALAAFVVEHSKGAAILMGGDFNLVTPPDDPQPFWTSFLHATGLTDVCAVLTDCTERGDAGDIDKWLFRSSDDVEITPVARNVPRERFTRPDGVQLSDHRPIEVTFDVTRSGGNR